MIRLTTRRMVWGLVLTALGLAWVVRNLGLAYFDLGTLIGLYWPVIPIFFMTMSMFEMVQESGGVHKGFIWAGLAINVFFTAVFVVMLGNNLDWWDLDVTVMFKVLIPAVLVFIGVRLMTGTVQRPNARSYWGIMSGAKDVRTTWDDLTITNIMGGSSIDMSRAGLPDREIIVEVFSLMGGGDLKLPAGVTVICEATSIMGGAKVFGHDVGGFVDARTVTEGAGPVVRVRMLSVMGGFDIKQY
ncbi:MAG TPA: LiaF domain-containing protein [Symbiobacteriaceae bacterium]|nr:LiaF domain-containing protein [Symbiobacteriaceae bacterium]